MYLQLFRNTRFLRIWAAQICSGLAANLLNFALVIRVYDLAQGSRYANVAVSLLIVSFALPSVIFAVVAGAYVDRWDRKKVLLWSNLIRAVLVLLFLVFEKNLFAVYGLVFLISIFTQFFIPAEAAALPRLVRKDQLLTTNSLFLFSFYASFVIGYSLAGPAVGLFGPQSTYIIMSGAFGLAALLVLGLPQLKPEEGTAHGRTVSSVLSQVRESLGEILRTKTLFFPLLNLTISQAVIGVIAVLAPALATILFHQSLTAASVKLIVPAAVAMVIGAILVGQWGKKANKVKLINYGIALGAASLFALGMVHRVDDWPMFIAIVIAISAVMGFANALVTVSAQTLLQLNTSDQQRGKVFGALNMLINIAALVPVVLAGISADIISPTAVLVGAAALLAAFGVVQRVTFGKIALKNA